MKAYLLTFDIHYLKFNYRVIHDKITKFSEVTDWFHFMESSYILISKSPASVLGEKIRNVIPEHRFLIVEIDLRERDGWLPKEAWEWIAKNRLKIALEEIKKTNPKKLK